MPDHLFHSPFCLVTPAGDQSKGAVKEGMLSPLFVKYELAACMAKLESDEVFLQSQPLGSFIQLEGQVFTICTYWVVKVTVPTHDTTTVGTINLGHGIYVPFLLTDQVICAIVEKTVGLYFMPRLQRIEDNLLHHLLVVMTWTQILSIFWVLFFF